MFIDSAKFTIQKTFTMITPLPSLPDKFFRVVLPVGFLQSGIESKSPKRTPIILLLLVVTIVLVACSKPSQRLGQQQALKIAWEALKPNTLSHNVESWEVDEARKVVGGEVVSEFAMPSRENCPGPKPPDNQPIKVSSEYWYIKVMPHPQVWRPQKDTAAPNSMLIAPEPNITSALFLIDIYSGEVVARKLICQDIP